MTVSEETKARNRIRAREWNKNNPEKRRAAYEKWRDSLTKEQKEEYRKDNRDYYLHNREKILAKRKRHYLINKIMAKRQPFAESKRGI